MNSAHWWSSDSSSRPPKLHLKTDSMGKQCGSDSRGYSFSCATRRCVHVSFLVQKTGNLTCWKNAPALYLSENVIQPTQSKTYDWFTDLINAVIGPSWLCHFLSFASHLNATPRQALVSFNPTVYIIQLLQSTSQVVYVLAIVVTPPYLSLYISINFINHWQ